MKTKSVLKWFLLLLLITVVFTGCSNSSDTTESEISSKILQDDDSMKEITEHEKNVLKFIVAVEENDAEALFDLIEIRHDEDVYWTVKEAGDLIEYLSQSESTMRDELGNLGISHESLVKDPYNPTELPDEYITGNQNGFVFLYEDGELGVKVFEHFLDKDSRQLGSPEKVILTYSDEKQITLEVEENDLNDKIGYFGPGNYEVHGKGFFNDGEVKENTSEMEIRGTDSSSVDNIDFQKNLTINLK